MKYTVLIEEGPTNFGAYIPDLPGCVAVADSREEVIALIKEGIAYHLELMREGWRPYSRAEHDCTCRRSGIASCDERKCMSTRRRPSSDTFLF